MTSETQKCQSLQKVVRDVDWVMFNPDLGTRYDFPDTSISRQFGFHWSQMNENACVTVLG
eukprot:13376469-Ditylum_brightwellii.AAC.1